MDRWMGEAETQAPNARAPYYIHYLSHDDHATRKSQIRSSTSISFFRRSFPGPGKGGCIFYVRSAFASSSKCGTSVLLLLFLGSKCWEVGSFI